MKKKKKNLGVNIKISSRINDKIFENGKLTIIVFQQEQTTNLTLILKKIISPEHCEPDRHDLGIN